MRDMGDGCHYILITPVKNELNNVDNLVKSVIEQVAKPILWVIVDDNSTDGTHEKLEGYAKKYNFIKIISYPEKKNYDVGIHYSEVCKYGFDFAIDYCKSVGCKYDYIGLLDADIVLERDYFKKLIDRMESDAQLGIVSGEIYSWNGKRYIKESVRDDYPRGAARLWRRACFEDTGGFLISYSPDTVSNIKAIVRGWKIDCVKNATAYQSRMTSSAQGLYVGWKKEGESSYYLYKSPFGVILKSINHIISGRIMAGIGYFVGYFSSFVNRKSRIEDKEVREYLKKYDLKNIMNYWLRRKYHEKV